MSGISGQDRPPPLVGHSSTIVSTQAWCANCFKSGHPAYQCPLPHRKVWPEPSYKSLQARRLLP